MRLRVGMHWHVKDGKALDGYAFYDAPALFDQLGTDLLARAREPDAPRFTFHAAFDPADARPDAPPRRAMIVRCAAFFDD